MPILRIAILGAESTGKSTLAAALAAHYQTIWVAEFLREFVETRQRTPYAEEQLLIATTQREREEESESRANRLLFCDTSPLMTALYSEHYFGGVDAELAMLAAQHDYGATIVTAPTTPWVADGLQRESDVVRQHIHIQLMRKLYDAGIAYRLVDGSLQQRVMQIVDYLSDGLSLDEVQ
ncbi:ATP-binding protein [Methylobacillus gramineus]|uniref:AAA family ATPase n=1 Tax=Methylobacillus gramineus TaxID=755169 RepID=UPI001CFFCFAE|nr:ATP-binding protein [Methylobacillus gramineus]MCB5183747.1 ATP-binding protein [Methylobacillus gramineus]